MFINWRGELKIRSWELNGLKKEVMNDLVYNAFPHFDFSIRHSLRQLG